MYRAFLSRSFAHRYEMQTIVESIQQSGRDLNIDVYDFVTRNTFEATDAAVMMQTSFAEIQKADFMIAEVSYKAIGVGIEIGYAVALQKPVLYLRQSSSEMSTTVSGIASVSLFYDNQNDLTARLPAAFQVILETLSG